MRFLVINSMYACTYTYLVSIYGESLSAGCLTSVFTLAILSVLWRVWQVRVSRYSKLSMKIVQELGRQHVTLALNLLGGNAIHMLKSYSIKYAIIVSFDITWRVSLQCCVWSFCRLLAKWVVGVT